MGSGVEPTTLKLPLFLQLSRSSASCPRAAEGWTWVMAEADGPVARAMEPHGRAFLPPVDRAASCPPAVAPADVPDGPATPAAAAGTTDSAAAGDYSPPRADGSGAAHCRDRLLRRCSRTKEECEWLGPAAEDSRRHCPELRSQAAEECASRARMEDSHLQHSAEACSCSCCHYPRWKAADCARFDPRERCRLQARSWLEARCTHDRHAWRRALAFLSHP